MATASGSLRYFTGQAASFPSPLTEDLNEFVDVVVAVSRSVVKIIGATRELSRSAFGTRQTNVILDFVAQVEAGSGVAMTCRLFASSARARVDLPPVDAMFLYQLLAAIGEIADNAEKVAHRAQIIATSASRRGSATFQRSNSLSRCELTGAKRKLGTCRNFESLLLNNFAGAGDFLVSV